MEDARLSDKSRQRYPEYTLVTQVYGRHHLWQIQAYASHYANEKARKIGCRKLLIVWNNLDVPMIEGSSIEAAAPVDVVTLGTNSMNNRFLVSCPVTNASVALFSSFHSLIVSSVPSCNRLGVSTK